MSVPVSRGSLRSSEASLTRTPALKLTIVCFCRALFTLIPLCKYIVHAHPFAHLYLSFVHTSDKSEAYRILSSARIQTLRMKFR